MTATFSEVQERLASASLREVIILASAGVEGRTFNELAALRERFLDIAFREELGEFDDRLLAAVWSRALDSALMLVLEDRPETRSGYISARSVSMEEVVQHGFGSFGRDAVTDQERMLNRLSFSSLANAEVDKIRMQQAYLVAAAFGVEARLQSDSAA